jgi:hypothetical protein
MIIKDKSSFTLLPLCIYQVDTSTIPGEEVGLRLAHAAGFLPSSYLNDSDEGGRDWRDRDMDELTQVMVMDFFTIKID